MEFAVRGELASRPSTFVNWRGCFGEMLGLEGFTSDRDAEVVTPKQYVADSVESSAVVECDLGSEVRLTSGSKQE